MAEVPPEEPKKTSLGMDENIEGLLTYVLGALTGIIFLILEKESDFVRFHAMQSTILFIGLWILQIILGAIFGPLGTLVALIEIVVWIVGMLKAYQGERYKFPIVGDLAEQWVEKV
ncbi:hypothetical protein A3L11_08070 [Thermococcus siculi]|uniref:DUF4870 domain-containing protein n=1 Tax=Thermococcus siculi TaxID=72803 RepID=A0A2Z2MMZ4_9EURY|nr:DUF4870 domain-containing protein [Thermococcus siculi]ASJ09188.1 hypothetical protein A3L11_08070 [Thermococcus siculi]